MQNIFALAARVLLSILFIVAGYGKLTGFEGTVGYFGSIGLPVPTVTAALVTALELLGGIAILLGLFARPVAVALALFCVASGFVAHFQPADQMQMINFMKNLGLAGGFLMITAFGPGAFSIDARRA
ncbi:putative oxidoreductase [Rhizobium sp. RU20A]|uniref:DoxX family protein n=1 Tax=Rhizobium sp. RU20A TaxID=1907412 RepID=UPI0009555AF8|nr:DoxX family protein [Rhizobium sp. RU20A]SIQ68511.1 putative oxidoreductase [Rhizobium sp. RU20A]